MTYFNSGNFRLKIFIIYLEVLKMSFSTASYNRNIKMYLFHTRVKRFLCLFLFLQQLKHSVLIDNYQLQDVSLYPSNM